MLISKKIGVAQIGSKHGHAISVLSTIINNPRVNFIGLYEPEFERREELKKINKFPFNKIKFLDKEENLYADNVIAIASEGANIESLNHTFKAVSNKKHVFDKFVIFFEHIDIFF